ncbi:MAG: PEP/pyruvate-binding domain-containing protein [Streptosporangiales bacterium]
MGGSGRSGAVVALHAAVDGERARVGSKAATLGQLARAGLAVPDGLVLTTDMSQDAEEALAGVAAHFDGCTMAVRSSATAEDLPDASFAGQYETVLHVRGLDGLRDAVRRCRASADSERVRAYARMNGSASRIAVLVQRQVDADVAGVAFTADPVSGSRDEVLVSAVPGLADKLVGGEVSPDEWRVADSSVTAVRVTHQALAEPQVRAVAALAARAEHVLGGPQDVEWAMADGRLLVLQSRPVTALPQQPAVALSPGTWVKDTGRHPEPITPFGASLVMPMVADGLSAMYAEFGALVDRAELRSIGGEVYVRSVPVGGDRGGPPPWWVLGALARLAPPLRRRLRAAARSARPEVFDRLITRWYEEWLPEFRDAATRLREVDLETLDDAALDAHIEATIALARRALGVHFRLIPAYAVPLHGLVTACRRMLGWSSPAALELVAGASPVSSAPARALAELATAVRACPAALALVEWAEPDLAAQLDEAAPELGASFAAWRDSYGYRAVNDDPGSPTLVERPVVLAGLLRDAVTQQRSDAPDPVGVAQQAVERARTLLADRSPRDRRGFEAVLAAARRSYPVREETAFWGACLPAGLARLAAVETGRRLVRRGVLARPDDAAFVEVGALRAALGGAQGPALHEVVRRNRAEQAWARSHPGPARYGAAAALPDVRALPGPARRLNAALLWAQREQDAGQAAEPGARRELTGVPGSPGLHTGPVRVVRGESEFHRLRPGDVLVCPTTDPAWSVLFGTAGALVTDGGGLLSHAAIVAREHAIPAVIGTGSATSQLCDGDVVTVDGTRGEVRQ